MDTSMCTPFKSNSDEQHPADIVSYLIAAKVGDNINDAAASFVYLRRQEVIKEKGLVPPGPPYNEAYQSKQLVPVCYRHLFPNGSCYLPDYTALELLGNQGHFHPKDIVICTCAHILDTIHLSQPRPCAL